MDSLAFIFGIGVVSFIFLYFSQSFDEKKHPALKLLMLMFALALVILVPKVTIDDQHICETVVDNSTEVSSTITSYEYTYFCYYRTESTPDTFYRIVLWTYRLFIAYIITYLAYLAVTSLRDSIKGRRR